LWHHTGGGDDDDDDDGGGGGMVTMMKLPYRILISMDIINDKIINT
jgi:hypothetical protein